MTELSMRDAFLNELYGIARRDRNVVLLSNDFGAPSLDKFRRDLPGQFVHMGVAEQNMVNVAAGLAMAGKIVYMYSISPFLPLRCYEQIRVHLCFKGLHVTGVGVGAGFAYDKSGPTHHSVEDIAAMRVLPNMTILSCSDRVMAGAFAELTYKTPGPKYIRLDREKLPKMYMEGSSFEYGLSEVWHGEDIAIIATGYMVHKAIEVAKAEHVAKIGVVDLYRAKPVNEKALLEIIKGYGAVMTLEEHFVDGGIGTIVAEVLNRNKWLMPLMRIGIPDQYYFEYGGREALHRICGLDVESITKRIQEWLK